MATAPRVGQDNEKTMTREQRTMTWMGRTKGENKEKSEWSKFPACSDEYSPSWHECWVAEKQSVPCPGSILTGGHGDCATAGTPDGMFDHGAHLTGLTGADRHAMKSRQSTCSSPRQGLACA